MTIIAKAEPVAATLRMRWGELAPDGTPARPSSDAICEPSPSSRPSSVLSTISAGSFGGLQVSAWVER